MIAKQNKRMNPGGPLLAFDSCAGATTSPERMNNMAGHATALDGVARSSPSLSRDTAKGEARASSVDVSANLVVAIADKSALFDPETGTVLESGTMKTHNHTRQEGQSSWYIGVGHLITALIGGGILSLPSSFAALGWGLSPILLALFGAGTIWSSYHLAYVYEIPGGKTFYTYKEAVAGILGGHHPYMLAFIQYLNMFLAAIGYTLAGVTSMKFIARTACDWDITDPYDSGYVDYDGSSSCPFSDTKTAILLFSGLQVIINMLPNLESVWWVSATGAAMSYLYSSLAVILSAKQLADAGPAPDTTAWGSEAETPFLRAIGMFSALGNLAFAWSVGLMLPSIQATLKEPPKSVVSMRKVIVASYSTTGTYYFAIAFLGYAALGSAAPGDVLTGFNVSKEVQVMANVAVLLHMVAAVQVYMHPMYEEFEELICRYAPRLLVDAPLVQVLTVRFLYRTACTVLVTIVGYELPYFSLIAGLNGAVTFWPLQIQYPFSMFMKAYPQPKRIRILMHITSAFFVVVCILATIGCVYALATASH